MCHIAELAAMTSLLGLLNNFIVALYMALLIAKIRIRISQPGFGRISQAFQMITQPPPSPPPPISSRTEFHSPPKQLELGDVTRTSLLPQ